MLKFILLPNLAQIAKFMLAPWTLLSVVVVAVCVCVFGGGGNVGHALFCIHTRN